MKKEELIKFWREQDKKYKESTISEPESTAQTSEASQVLPVFQIQPFAQIVHPSIDLKINLTEKSLQLNGNLPIEEVKSFISWVNSDVFKKSEPLPPAYTK